MSTDSNTPFLPQSSNWQMPQKQVNQSQPWRAYARAGRSKSSGTRKIALRRVLVITLLLLLGLFDHATGFAMAAKPASSTCVNSVAGGVYLDANGNRLHERNEPFLAGTIQVVSNASAFTDLIESADGLFVLDNLACDDYAVYHNGDYVGDLAIGEVTGQVLIELPKTSVPRIFIPLVMR